MGMRMDEKLSTKICETIREEILSGVIGPRTFLSEKEVAQRFGVSKAPVRDALHLLTNQGYLISYPRRGYLVNQYTENDFRQIQQIRFQLEKLSVSLAIENASDEEIETLLEFTLEDSKESDPSRTDNTQFHMRLAEIGKNEFLPGILSDLLNKISLMHIKDHSDLKKHRDIIDALKKRDVALAQSRLAEDMMI